MRIPQAGDRINYVLGMDDNGPIVRPGIIISVSSYTPRNATVNLMVFLDGELDKSLTLKRGMRVSDSIGWVVAAFRSGLQEVSTWDYCSNVEMNCEDILVNNEITHGREIIKAGAVGVFDEMKNTITFKEEDVTNLGNNPSVYQADQFVNQHCARLTPQDGFKFVLKVMDPKNPLASRELPSEWARFVDYIVDRELNPHRYIDNASGPRGNRTSRAIEKVLDLLENHIEDFEVLRKAYEDAVKTDKHPDNRLIQRPANPTTEEATTTPMEYTTKEERHQHQVSK